MSARPSAEAPPGSRGPLELALLGPFEARYAGEPLALGGRRPRALLALLALNRGAVLSVDRIVDELWGESSPATARHIVQVYVSRLRKMIGDGVLLTKPPGYVLEIQPEQFDLARFERLLAEGRDAFAVSDPGSAAALLGEALALWRGPALSDFAYEPFAQTEIARLEELRVLAEEERIEAELALGNAPELIGRLEQLIAAAPFRERLRGQLMLALYRAGRQADALAAYAAARETLVEDLGVEPSPELRQLERAILGQEEWLAGEHPSAPERTSVPATRRVITVLFAELAVGETEADLEAVQPLARRLLQRAEGVLEHHGATAEGLPDGTLMGVFGSPVAHEDDGLRSLRAAQELRELGVVFRAGLDTGEVLAGEPSVSGPAVRSAAMLLAAASPGDILVGRATRQLSAHAAHFRGPLALEGVEAWRLLEVIPAAPARPLRVDAPMVGRGKELAELREVFARTARDRRPRLVTVVGEPGIGKSRLTREFGREIETETLVLTGRCLAYGEGITYWPLREILRQIDGEERATLLGFLAQDDDREAIADRLTDVLGTSASGYPVEEIRWAARRLFEALARDTPAVIVFEDIHWAEPTFLDLIDHVTEVSDGAPILVVCTTRPELADDRPEWIGQDERSLLTLEALEQNESTELLARLAPHGLVEERRTQIVDTASGNPLFLEQLVAFAAERAGNGGNGGESRIPPTLRALLAARIDRLGPGERAVIERAAVIGREFWAGAVRELLLPTARATLVRHLGALIKKGLIEREFSALPFEDAFRFRHVLIQDAAYGSLPKERRAELHERLTGWLDRIPVGVIGDEDEIVGYHLEHAHRYRAELGSTGEHEEALASRAAERLAAAATRAATRGDMPAQVNLLSRAVELLRNGDQPRSELMAELGYALQQTGDYAKAESVLGKAIEIAASANDSRVEARALIALVDLHYSTEPGFHANVRPAADHAIEVFARMGDELGLARAWRLIAFHSWGEGQAAASQEAWERSVEHARRAGSRRDELSGLAWLASVAVFGPTPVRDAQRRCDEILEQVKGDLLAETDVLGLTSWLHVFEGRFDEARVLQARRTAVFEELGLELAVAWLAQDAGFLEMLAGDADAAERVLRTGFERLERAGARADLGIVGTYLAQALYLQKRYEEAEHLALSIEEIDPPAILEGAYARSTRAKAIAKLGRVEEGEQLARKAMALIDRTDFPIDRGNVRMDLAEVLVMAKRPAEAAHLLGEAVRLNEEKGNIVSAQRGRALLAELDR